MFEYIFQGPPTTPAGLNPALALDEVDNTLYIWSAPLTSWVQVGNSSGANDSVQNLNTSQPISMLGSTNTFVKATAGAGGITLALPSAVGLSGRSIRVMMVDTGPGVISLTPQISQSINGVNNYVLSNQYQAATFESDNANWFIVAIAN